MSESACGGASSDSTDSDKSSSVECPTCGRDDFASRKGMKIHHKATHGESLAGTAVVCDWCGDSYRKDVYEAKQYDTNLCSSECKSEWCSDNHTNEGNPSWNGGPTTRPCSWCGDTIERTSAFMQSEKVFCDRSCQGKYQSEHSVGEDNPAWKGGVVYCSWCGEELDRDMNQIERSERFFCGDNCCKAKWQSKHFKGENHPNWSGGAIEYYGPNWPEQRRRARVRDQSRCQICGKTPLDLGEEVDVHHKKKIRWFKTNYNEPEWWQRANDLDNLICYCRSCHLSVESYSPLVPMTE